MRARRKGLGILIVTLVLGILIGTTLGEILGIILPEGVVRDFFVKSVSASLEPTTIDLVAFSFTLGFSIKLNVISILGVFMGVYILRWY